MKSAKQHISSLILAYAYMALGTLNIVIGFYLQGSRADLWLQGLFFISNEDPSSWLISKQAYAPKLIFYDAPKLLLGLFGLYLLASILLATFNLSEFRCASLKKQGISSPPSQFNLPLFGWSLRQKAYLFTALALTPLMVGLLKDVTRVACPVQIVEFGGDYAHLSVWQIWQQSMQLVQAQLAHARCFPAAHASAGFGLIALSLLPKQKNNKFIILTAALLIGWTMGLYKMAIGDHFFSHTLTSMGFGFVVSGLVFYLWFSRQNSNPPPV